MVIVQRANIELLQSVKVFLRKIENTLDMAEAFNLVAELSEFSVLHSVVLVYMKC